MLFPVVVNFIFPIENETRRKNVFMKSRENRYDRKNASNSVFARRCQVMRQTCTLDWESFQVEPLGIFEPLVGCLAIEKILRESNFFLLLLLCCDVLCSPWIPIEILEFLCTLFFHRIFPFKLKMLFPI